MRQAQTVLARARCIVRHPGATWYELAEHWGFKGHAQIACEQLALLGFIRIERAGGLGRGNQPNRMYPA